MASAPRCKADPVRAIRPDHPAAWRGRPGGQDHGGLQAGLTAGLPDVANTAPDAPFGHDDNPALRQWYSLTGVTRANRPPRVAGVRGALDTLLRSQIAAQGFAGRLYRVALVSFSQGATMVFDAIASGRWPVAAAVTFACSVTRPDPVAPPPGTKMLMVHGSADRAVPPGNSATGRTLLRRHGLDAHHLVCAGVGYESSPAATVYAARFIGSALRAKS